MFLSSGVFSCTAQNSQGESKKFFSVDVASAPHADDLETKIFMQKPGKEVVLDCSDVEGSPKPNFFWFKDKYVDFFDEKIRTFSKS